MVSQQLIITYNNELPNVQEQLGQQTINNDMDVEMPIQIVENDNLQAQQPTNNGHQVTRLFKETRQHDLFVPSANNVVECHDEQEMVESHIVKDEIS